LEAGGSPQRRAAAVPHESGFEGHPPFALVATTLGISGHSWTLAEALAPVRFVDLADTSGDSQGVYYLE
jgi:hypothetical protein